MSQRWRASIAVADACIQDEGPQQAEILDADAEIQAEILLESEIRNPIQYIFPIISVKYGNYVSHRNPIDFR